MAAMDEVHVTLILSKFDVLIVGGDGSVADMSAAFGSPDDAPYDDPTGAADGTVISLLKAIYINTIPAD